MHGRHAGSLLHRGQRPVGHDDAAADPRPRPRRGDPARVDVPHRLRRRLRARRAERPPPRRPPSWTRSGTTRRCGCGSSPAPRPPCRPGSRGPDAYRFVVEAPFRAYAAKHGKPRWADKTPHYVHHVDHLLAIWPRARFVVLVRDGRDVTLSLRKMPFGPNNAWAAAPWWARGIRAGEQAQSAHPDQVLTVRYEDLAGAPAEVVPRICEFVELSYTPEMLALEDADPSKIVPDQASLVPDAVRRHQHDGRRPLAARDERARPARVRGPRGRGARAPRLRRRPPTAPSASRRGRSAGSTTRTSSCATSTSCACGSSRSAAASCASRSRAGAAASAARGRRGRTRPSRRRRRRSARGSAPRRARPCRPPSRRAPRARSAA